MSNRQVLDAMKRAEEYRKTLVEQNRRQKQIIDRLLLGNMILMNAMQGFAARGDDVAAKAEVFLAAARDALKMEGTNDEVPE